MAAVQTEPRRNANSRFNQSRDPESATFFTFGYSGRSIRDLIGVLKEAGVQTVVDIRFSPVSMHRPEFSKRNLRAELDHEGIEYLHLRQLGVPKDIRDRAYYQGDRAVIWEWYEDHVVSRFVERNLHWFFDGANHPVAFMCVEADPTTCHRHRLAMALERHGLPCFDL